METLPPELNKLRENLIREVYTAFAGVSREGGISLHETKVIDDHCTQAEREEARRLDKDRTWSEIKKQDLEKFVWLGGLVFFDKIGWRYHLPAYMLAIVQVPSTSWDLANHLIFSLSSDSRDRFSFLSEAQCLAVANFLRFMIRLNECEDWNWSVADAESALKNHWSKYVG